MSATEPASRWLAGVEGWNAAHAAAVDVITTLTIALVLGSLTVSGSQGLHWSGPWALLLVVAFAVLHLSVAARRRWPELAYAVASVCVLLVVLAPDAQVAGAVAGGATRVPAVFLPSNLVFLIVLFSVAARTSVAVSRAVLLVALAGAGLTAGTVSGALRGVAAGGWLLTFALGVGLGLLVVMTWTLGRLALFRRRRADRDRAESARLAVGQERARIAREMHDIVAHSLAVIVRQAEGGAFVAGTNPATAERALQTIADTGRCALTDMRGLLGVLRAPGDEDGDGPGTAPRPSLADLPRLVTGVRTSGVDVELAESGTAFTLGASTELAVYRLVQEGLTNALKHAGPGAHVTVTLAWRCDELRVEVNDDGGGHPGAPPVPGAGAGLRGLHERVTAVGGAFSASRGERGFDVRAGFPRAVGGS
ncbi:MAG: histidine kinase [Mycobacteriaceae bacterium]